MRLIMPDLLRLSYREDPQLQKSPAGAGLWI